MVSSSTLPEAASAARTLACERIAPVWPLDESIAVNPWWGLTGEPLSRAAARLSVLGGVSPLMPRTYFRKRLAEIANRDVLLDHALAEQTTPAVDGLRARGWLDGEPRPLPRLQLVTDVLDASADLRHEISWGHCVVHQISQFCAARFDQGQAFWKPAADRPLYTAWRDLIVHERSTSLLAGARELPALFRALPEDSDAVFALARRSLEVSETDRVDHLHALLLSVNGWASWCAGRRWQAELRGKTDDDLEQLLAVRLGWEIVLAQLARTRGIWQDRSSQPPVAEMIAETETAQAPGWIWQRVLELAYREPLRTALHANRAEPEQPTPPQMQAYFCIDVRSEVYRRALESLSPAIRTGGFAGFFGLPVAYHPLGVDAPSARLPGLLAPSMNVRDYSPAGAAADASLGDRRKTRLARHDLARRLTATGTSAFPAVEALGLSYGWKLLRDSWGAGGGNPATAGLTAAEAADLSPRLEWPETDASGVAKVDLAARVLRAMSLTRDFAPLVLLVGHGGQSDNNPHQAGLDCGACCGHAGDVNARALADLLNENAVREGLAQQGIHVPATTRFVAALHNTTTDAVTLFGNDADPAALAEARAWLADASELARRERAKKLGGASDAEGSLHAFQNRARNWAQIRPEWALANNAAFIAAPRGRTRGLDLDGRAFLHDYAWQADEGFAVLELILTAPVAVAHWINFQYYASTVDNRRYGSGNKMLHNVVGGNLGVFEGNGGDLRIGLPLQSLHDGADWRHEPLRLQVIVDAPGAAIDGIVARHESVRRLLAHQWCSLARLESDGTLQDWTPDGWKPAS